jgi:hypothetical protein
MLLRRLLRPLCVFGAVLGLLAFPAPKAEALRTSDAVQAATVAVAATDVLFSPAEAFRTLSQLVAARVIEATRQFSPGLAERIDSLLAKRRGGAEGAPQSAAARTGSALAQVAGVAIIGLVIALIVLVTALGPLEGIIRTVEADVSGAFWRGLLAQTITLPLIGAILLALAVTVIGLLVVPIVLFLSVLGMAGVGTLGALAVAAVIGRARASNDRARSRAGLLRALLLGYGLIWLPWLVAALLVAVPGVGLATRIVALASTWVVVTVGIGAVIRSRGGLRVPDVVPARVAAGAPAPQPDWSTPTPVSGVVAARRPTPAEQHAGVK